eukprot:5439495-Amphidinium_carterae.1
MLSEPHFARVGPPRIDAQPQVISSSEEEGQGEAELTRCDNLEELAGTWQEQLAAGAKAEAEDVVDLTTYIKKAWSIPC